MKTLYLSDLDGTLFNRRAELSDYTVEHLNTLLENGVSFSVATARTAVSCSRLLDRLKLKLPAILMNGVLIYDFASRNYIKKEILAKEKAQGIIDAARKLSQRGLMYSFDGEEPVTYYEELSNRALREFVDERVRKYRKTFIRVPNFSAVDSERIYFAFMDEFEKISRLYEEIRLIPGLRIEKYRDIYTDSDLWYLEVFSDTASKYNAALYLKKEYGFDRIVAFGDNLNDLPLFEASDACYAVQNAKKEVKLRADAVIGENEDDGVVKWIEKTEAQ